jgi:hypothetical protein
MMRTRPVFSTMKRRESPGGDATYVGWSSPRAIVASLIPRRGGASVGPPPPSPGSVAGGSVGGGAVAAGSGAFVAGAASSPAHATASAATMAAAVSGAER